MQKALTEKQERLLALFRVAIEREQESQKLYEEMAGTCEDAELRQVIESLRNSEQMHEELLMERYKFLREGPPFSS
jgi:rubrerythrin